MKNEKQESLRRRETFVSVVSFNDVTIPAFFFCWLASRLLFRAEEWRAGLFALAMKTWERELKEENLVQFKSFQRMPSRLWRKSREVADSTPVKLQGIIKKFVLAVRKKNGKEYERSSLAKRLKYPKHRPASSQNQLWILLNDREFCKVQEKEEKESNWTVNVQVYQTIRTEKSSKIRCENKLKITVSQGQ